MIQPNSRIIIFIYITVILLFLNSCCSEDAAKESSRLLYSDSAKDRNAAAMKLASCGKKAEPSVPKLIELLYDDNVGVQSSAAYALRKIGTAEAKEALDRATKRR